MWIDAGERSNLPLCVDAMSPLPTRSGRRLQETLLSAMTIGASSRRVTIASGRPMPLCSVDQNRIMLDLCFEQRVEN